MKRFPGVRMVSPSVSPFILVTTCRYPHYLITHNTWEKPPGMMAWFGPFGLVLFRITVIVFFIAIIRWIMLIRIDAHRCKIEYSIPDILKRYAAGKITEDEF